MCGRMGPGGVRTAGGFVCGATISNTLVGQTRAVIIWDETGDYKTASVAARMSSSNFNTGPVPTLKFKALPGCTAEDVTPADKAILDANRVNVYTTVGRGVELASRIRVDVPHSRGGWQLREVRLRARRAIAHLHL